MKPHGDRQSHEFFDVQLFITHMKGQKDETARLKNARDLAEGGRVNRRRQIYDRVKSGDSREAGIGKGQCGHVALDEEQVGIETPGLSEHLG